MSLTVVRLVWRFARDVNARVARMVYLGVKFYAILEPMEKDRDPIGVECRAGEHCTLVVGPEVVCKDGVCSENEKYADIVKAFRESGLANTKL